MKPKVGTLVSVRWMDAVIASAGWRGRRAMVKGAAPQMAHVAAGIVAATTKEALIICSGYSQINGRGAGCIAIPRRAILSLRQHRMKP